METIEAEHDVRSLREIPFLDIGSSRWLQQHVKLERLNLLSHNAARTNSDDFVLSAFVTYDKFHVVLVNLLRMECWRENIFSRIMRKLAEKGGTTVMRAYFVLHHETVLLNLLESFLYHDYAAEAFGESLLDLIDYLVRNVTRLVNLMQGRSARIDVDAELAELKEDDPIPIFPVDLWSDKMNFDVPQTSADISTRMRQTMENPVETAFSQLRQWRGETVYRLGVSSVSILRYLSEFAKDLPLFVSTRLLSTHELPLLMVPLLENPPWVRRGQRLETRSKEDGEVTSSSSATKEKLKKDAATKPKKVVIWQKYVNNKWIDVEPKDLLKLTPMEGQPWLTLYALMLEPEFRRRYPLTSYRKGTILRVRRYMNEMLLDQLPPLAHLQRWMDEISLVSTAEADDSAGKWLMDMVPEVFESVLADAETAPEEFIKANEPPKDSGTLDNDKASKETATTTTTVTTTADITTSTELLDGGPQPSALQIVSADGQSTSSTGKRKEVKNKWTWLQAADHFMRTTLRDRNTGGSGRGRNKKNKKAASSKPSDQDDPVGDNYGKYAAWPDSDDDNDLKALGDLYTGEEFAEAADPEVPTCLKCGEFATKRCSRCQSTWYCSRECQVGDWKEHKPSCDILHAELKRKSETEAAANVSNYVSGDVSGDATSQEENKKKSESALLDIEKSAMKSASTQASGTQKAEKPVEPKKPTTPLITVVDELD